MSRWLWRFFLAKKKLLGNAVAWWKVWAFNDELKPSKLQRVRRHFFAIWQRRWKPGIVIEDCELVCDGECHVQNSPQVTKADQLLPNGTYKLHPSNFNFINILALKIFQIVLPTSSHSHDSILPVEARKEGGWTFAAVHVRWPAKQWLEVQVHLFDGKPHLLEAPAKNLSDARASESQVVVFGSFL